MKIYKNVLEFLEESSEKYENKTAVKDDIREFTFGELCDASQRAGSFLAGYPLRGKVVPVYMEKSVLTLTVFLGIVYAGGCYSLLNPLQPDARKRIILDTISSPIIITDREHFDEISSAVKSEQIICVEDMMDSEIDSEALTRIRNYCIDTDPLYVNFTSGSTGTPKGVAVCHRSVIEFMRYFVDIFKISSEDIIGNQAPFDFDVSVKDIYSMLITGATLYLIPKDYFSFPKKTLDVIENERITVLIWAVSALCVISALKGFKYKKPESIRKVMFSGEVMPIVQLKAWMDAFPKAEFVNLYGPTEITCNCTYYIIDKTPEEGSPIPVGKCFPNERVLLFDENNKLITEANKTGEICVSGSTLALGYYKDPEKTKLSFVKNPEDTNNLEIMYRTGDLGYWREDENLMYVGRKDFQIKHLGHRIELGEIETHIGSIEGIEHICCQYDENKDQIVAFYQGEVEKTLIKNELRKKMIKYMIPEKYINVDRMPLTKNGKIDRKKLREEYL